MNNEELEKLNQEILLKIREIMINKGDEYRTNENVFSNFMSMAGTLNLTKYQIWAVYFTKHVYSIQKAIKKSPQNPDLVPSKEDLESRIIDCIAYLLLLNGMIKSEVKE